jgi:CBS domain-containing protein
MIIGTAMKRHVISIPAQAPVEEAIHLLVDHHIGTLPVVDKAGKLVGGLSLHELLGLVLPTFVEMVGDIDFVQDFGAVETSKIEVGLLRTPVGELARPVTSVREDCGLLRAYAIMQKHDLHDLPVVDDADRLVGIASRVDVGTAFLRGSLLR